MKNVIYKIRNVVNDNFYIGSTTDTRKSHGTTQRNEKKCWRHEGVDTPT